MEAFFEDAAMKLPTPTPFKPRRARRIAAAYMAYFTSVCASMAAAAAVVTETVPLTLGGF
jgi:hypothetical protein